MSFITVHKHDLGGPMQLKLHVQSIAYHYVSGPTVAVRLTNGEGLHLQETIEEFEALLDGVSKAPKAAKGKAPGAAEPAKSDEGASGGLPLEGAVVAGDESGAA